MEVPAVFQLVDYVENRTVPARKELMRTLVRAAHPIALSLSGDSLNEDELDLLREYTGGFSLQRSSLGHVNPVQNQKFLLVLGEIAKQKMKQIPSNSVLSSLQKHWKRDSVSRSLFELAKVDEIERWKVKTSVWFMPDKIMPLQYTHRISFAHEEELPPIPLGRDLAPMHGISILDWLGVSPTTSWVSLFEGTAESVGMRLAHVLEIFLTTAPRLLKGLKPE